MKMYNFALNNIKIYYYETIFKSLFGVIVERSYNT